MPIVVSNPGYVNRVETISLLFGLGGGNQLAEATDIILSTVFSIGVFIDVPAVRIDVQTDIHVSYGHHLLVDLRRFLRRSVSLRRPHVLYGKIN